MDLLCSPLASRLLTAADSIAWCQTELPPEGNETHVVSLTRVSTSARNLFFHKPIKVEECRLPVYSAVLSVSNASEERDISIIRVEELLFPEFLPKGRNLNGHRCENLKRHISLISRVIVKLVPGLSVAQFQIQRNWYKA